MTDVVFRVNGGEWEQSETWDSFVRSFRHGSLLPALQPNPEKPSVPRNPDLSSNGFDTSAEDIFNETGIKVESPSWWAHVHYKITTGRKNDERAIEVECYWK